MPPPKFLLSSISLYYILKSIKPIFLIICTWSSEKYSTEVWSYIFNMLLQLQQLKQFPLKNNFYEYVL